MLAAKIRKIITLLPAYTIGPHRNKVSAFLMRRAKRPWRHFGGEVNRPACGARRPGCSEPGPGYRLSTQRRRL
jgi:hypothetical protein